MKPAELTNQLSMNTLQAHFLPVLDAQIQSQFLNLKKYIVSKGLKQYSPEDVTQVVEKYIQEQIMDIAKKQYLLMEKSDHFGEPGEQRVAISFCRVLLNIPASREVTQLDANLFRESLSAFDEKLGNPSVEKLKKELHVPGFEIWGKKYLISQDDEINQILKFIGSKQLLRFSFAQDGLEYILGEEAPISGVHRKFRDKTVILKKAETARSPLNILSMVAAASPLGTLIREASCETIFYNKWHSFYETSDFEKELLQSHDYSNIREAIKDKALKAYGFNNQAEVVAGKSLFIDEMVEGVVWHELGHAISLEGDVFIPRKIATLGSSVSSFGNEAITVLKEALADWAPPLEGAHGPIWHFIQLAKTDYAKAKRMVYVYLSDYWFLDVGEDFMGITTDVIVPLVVQFIDPNGEVDFKKMEKAHAEIFQYLAKRYIAGIAQIEHCIRSAGYQISSQNVISYDVLEHQLVEIYLEQPRNVGKSRDDVLKTAHFWINALGYLKKFSDSGYKSFKQALHDYSISFSNDLLNKLTQKSSIKFNNIREYVIHQMKAIGCYQLNQPKAPEDWINDAIADLEIPTAAAKTVTAKFKAVMDASEKVEVAIDYEGKPSPFVAVLQTILVKSEMGEILSGMAIGAGRSAESNLSPFEIKGYLAELAKHLESNDFQSVALLKVNERYLANASVFEHELNDYELKGGRAMKDLIRKVDIRAFLAEHALEVFVPLKKGFWDWNTVQAVWRINTEFRPEQIDLQWTVDGAFLKYIFEKIA